MNKDVLKENYFKTLKDDKRRKYSEGYEAYHIAVLSSKLIDHEENCIMLKGNNVDLIENQDYINWLNKKINGCDLTKIDIDKIKKVLKPIKKILKEFSPSREKEEIINKILEGK